MKTIETKAAKFEAGKTYYTTWRKSDGCEQIITCTIEKRTAHSVTINGKRHMIPRIDGTLAYPDIEYILVTADDGWKVHVDARNIYAVEEIADTNAGEVSEEIAEVNDRRFLVSVHYDNNGANGMASKHFATAAEAANYIIAFAKENPEYVINTDTNLRDFDAHKKYTLTDADLHILNSKPAGEEIAEINAADVKVNVADNGKVIEQIKVDVDTAIKIINCLNYRNDTFVYRHATFDDYDDIKYRHFDAYRDYGEKDAFAITEIVINGKLEIVRFANLFRDIIVHLQIGNVNYTIGDKGAIVLSDGDNPDNEPEEPVNPDDKSAAAKNYTSAFTTKTDKNGKTMYYINGKRRSHADYMYQLEQRQALVDELPDRRMRWLNKPEDIYEDATTLESVSGIERDEHIDAEIADKYIAIDGAAVQSVEVKQVGRSNSYYIDGKRTNRDKALDACAEMRGDNLFTIEYQRGRYGDDGKIVYSTERKTMSRLDLKINAHGDGYSVHFYNGFATVHIFEEYEDAKACFNQIEAAYLAGKAGVKVDSGGKVSDLDDRRTEKIGSDEVYYIGGKWQCTYSAKYHASFFRGIRSGELMYRIDDLKIVSEQEFWAAMIERGACTIDLTDAEELTTELKKVTRKSRLMEIYPQVGGRIVDPLHKVEIAIDGGGFIFTNGHETLARYDTKEQCLDVIERIKTAIEGYDLEFEFPTAELVDLEKKLPALMIEQFNKYRYRSKGRSIPRRFLAAQLKYYGLTPAQLKEAYHA